MKLRNVLMGAAASALCASAALAERGSDGQVNILYWQAVSIMTPYLSNGTKDLEAASLVHRAARPLQREGRHGALSRRRRSRRVENGGVSEDLTTITWKLKDGPRLVRRHAGHRRGRGLHLAVLHPSRGRLRPAAELRRRDQRRGGRPADDQGDLRRAEALSLRAVRRRAVADHPEGAVRRLPRRQGADLHRGQHQADRHRAVRGHRLQGERRGGARGEPELPRPGEAGLRRPWC